MGKRITTEEVLYDLEKNRNHSITQEIKNENLKKYNRTALFYRGTTVSYRQMLDVEVPKYVKAFRQYGVKKGMKIPMCVSNTPEFVYSLLALWEIGAIPKSFGEEFDEDYQIEILNSSPINFAIIGDNKYENVKNALNKSNITNIYMPSLCDSLPNGIDPFETVDSKFYKFEDRTSVYKKVDSRISNTKMFLDEGKKYVSDGTEEKVYLDDIASVTFSSGSTNSSHPKGIIHDVRSYIAMGRNHDPKVSGVPSMKKLRVLAHIPTHSNTDIQSSITDSLIQGSVVCLEPTLYSEESILYSMMINKPNFACVTKSMSIALAKQVFEAFKNNVYLKMRWLLCLMAVGEPTSLGEEKFLNKMLKKVKAGIDFTHTPSCVVSTSTAGADCEQGGVLFQMFRSLKNLTRKKKSNAFEAMRTYDMVDIIAINEKGEILKNGEIGRLYAKSPCTMIGYENEPEKTNNYFKVINGEKYGDMSVYGYTLPNREYVIKGRMGSERMPTPGFVISDAILKDAKHVMSCETISYDEGYYVAHIELQPDVSDKWGEFVSIYKRCVNILGRELADQVVFKMRSGYKSYPTTGCGKRSTNALRDEPLDNTFKVVNNDGYCSFMYGTDYLNLLINKDDDQRKR